MKKLIGFMQVIILICSLFSFSYMMSEAYNSEAIIKENSSFFKMYKKIVYTLISDKNLVSAESTIYTCVKDKNNSICQEYVVSSPQDIEKCNSICSTSCVPSQRKDISECKLGTCYDKYEGKCQAGAPKSACEVSGGKWFDDKFENVLECRKGCCFIGDQTTFVTEQQCKKISSSSGIELKFRKDVTDELSCLVLSKLKTEGACIFEKEFEKTCKFTTKESCIGLKGEFKENKLCSSEEFKTNCIAQQKTECVEGKDEIYWFDSCGNRENIYTGSTIAEKKKSNNNGLILSKNNTCELGSSTIPLKNQAICGNCNYLTGSICGQKTGNEKLSDNSQNFVCRDLRCDSNDDGIKDKLQGESWCEYQGAIGTEKGSANLLRSVDTPGSRHFREVCIDGEVKTEPCADYRNEICVEQKSPLKNTFFSSAACRINRWQQCIEYNTQIKSANNPSGVTNEQMQDKCSKNPDCFVKKVSIDKNFNFNICAPKYPPGFDLNINDKGAEGICSFASQKCTVVYVKKISGWKCVANCNCEKAQFTEQMNDLCMSLGDCGASVNYQGDLGDLTGSYSVKNAPKLSKSYLDTIYKYSELIKGKSAEPGNISEFFGSLGIPEDLGKADSPKDPSKALGNVGMISGIAGVGLIYAAQAGIGTGILSSVGLVGGEAAGFAAAQAAAATGAGDAAIGAAYTSASAPGLQALGGALAGAAIGFAVVILLIKFLGIGKGLDPAMVYGLAIAGAVFGAIIGANIAVGVPLAPIPVIGLIVIVVMIIVMKLLGVGKTKKINVQFSCNAWQPSNGGAKCEQCGKDGFPCSRYTCQSLGQTCAYINEGTGNELCVNIAPNDVSSPTIKPLSSFISKEFEYTDITSSGFKIKGKDGECISSYYNLNFGVELSEPGQCRFDVEHKNSFDEMEFEFGGSTLYSYNHTQLFQIPSLESLGLPGYDPSRKTEANLYLRCKDKSGNINEAEFAINFCVQPGEDLTPPIITDREPENEYVKFGTSALNSSVFTNEPSECKYSKQDKEYSLMEGQFFCNNDIEEQEISGWRCSSVLNVSQTKEDEFYYIRCKDQPWIDEESDRIVVKNGIDENGVEEIDYLPAKGKKRNENKESYRFIIKKSKSNLNIDYITPSNETLFFGYQPVTINIEAKTSGGVNGKAICSYKNGDNYINFFETFGTIHKQPSLNFFAGEKLLEVRCEDEAGNVAEKASRFKIEIDVKAPEVTRIYFEGQTIKLITNEESKCAVKEDSFKIEADPCNFYFDSNSTFMSGEEYEHTYDYDGRKLYIKCQDKYGNYPGECSIIAKRG